MKQGTTTHLECPICGNNTMDSSGDCHYAYCDEFGVTENDDKSLDNALYLSEEVLSITHNKTIEITPGFPFHDLKGNPMEIKDLVTIRWTPK